MFLGNPIMGDWYCLRCEFHIFPNPLQIELKNGTIKTRDNKPICSHCNNLLQYEEYA